MWGGNPVLRTPREIVGRLFPLVSPPFFWGTLPTLALLNITRGLLPGLPLPGVSSSSRQTSWVRRGISFVPGGTWTRGFHALFLTGERALYRRHSLFSHAWESRGQRAELPGYSPPRGLKTGGPRQYSFSHFTRGGHTFRFSNAVLFALSPVVFPSGRGPRVSRRLFRPP